MPTAADKLLNMEPFTRIQAKGTHRPLRVYFFSDTHLQACRSDDPLLPDTWRKAPSPSLARESRALLRSHLDRAVHGDADLILMAGDLFHFPSRENARMAQEEFKACPVSIRSVPGNHDWFYPGQDGYEPLRDTQLPLIQPPVDVTPWVMELAGIRFVGIDNSTYFLSTHEADVLCRELEEPGPVVVLMHIPPSTPDLRPSVIRKHGGAILMHDPDGRTRAGVDPEPTLKAVQALQTSPHLCAILAAHVHLPYEGSYRDNVSLIIPEAGYRDGFHWLEFGDSVGPGQDSA
jgi:hypothetical protein